MKTPPAPLLATKAAAAVQIVLVDDHQIMREGLRHLLLEEADLQIAGEAGDGRAALELVERLQPDLVIMDLGLPDGGGLDFARQIRTCWPAIKVIILSSLLERKYLDEAVQVGISGYVLKGNAASELIRAIRAAQKTKPTCARRPAPRCWAGTRNFSPPWTA